MEIIQTTGNSNCKPFSACWCESRPNHPHCRDMVELDTVPELGVFIGLAIILGYFVTKLKKNIIK